MNETMHLQSDKANKLGSATIAVHQSAVPPADHGSEVAEAAPLEVHAPKPYQVRSEAFRLGADWPQAKSMMAQ
jgi:hypothetical protein